MKVLHFPLGSLQVGLPLTQVQKVVPYPTVYSSGQKPVGLAHFEDQEVVVIDLHHYLFGQSNPVPATHLIVVKGNAELYGVPCTGMPALVDILPEQIRQIPPLEVERCGYTFTRPGCWKADATRQPQAIPPSETLLSPALVAGKRMQL